jgi:hypothetical protein
LRLEGTTTQRDPLRLVRSPSEFSGKTKIGEDFGKEGTVIV